MTRNRGRELKNDKGMRIRNIISSSVALALFGSACLGVMPGSALNVKAETIEIGIDGDATTKYYPTYELYNYALAQTIYTADEMGNAGGTITSVSYYRTGGYNHTRSVKIYLMDTEKDAFTTSTDWADVSGATLCYEGSTVYEQGAWTQIDFSTPFDHDSSANLLLFTVDETGIFAASASFKAYNDGAGQNMEAHTDDAPYEYIPSISASGSVRDQKISVIFGYEPFATETIVFASLPDTTEWLDPIREEVALGIGIAAESGAPATVYFEGDFSLPYEIMKKLQDNPGVTLVYNMLYKDTVYEIVIPGSEAVADPEIPWYGPEYLIGKYLAPQS